MTDSKFRGLKEKLDAADNPWPQLYMFKFIVEREHADEVAALLDRHEVKVRPSRNGRYVSLTAKMFANDSDAIIEVYEKASRIEGLIAL